MALAPSAHAATNDLNDFNMGTSWTSYPATYFATTSGGVSYRWLDSPPVWTQIAAYNCATGGQYSSAWINPGNTGYFGIGAPPAGWCFGVQGHTNTGYMYLYDGRVSR